MKDLTIIFNAYYSEDSLEKILKYLQKFKILIIENSLDKNIKQRLESKYKNIKVLIPNKNLGLAAGFNYGIKRTKTRYIFLNNPDIKIDFKSISKLLKYSKEIKRFGSITPIYNNEKVYKNYGRIYKYLTKKICAVHWADNNFLIDKFQIKKRFFDENFFLYFENIDFCLNLIRNNKEVLIAKDVKFSHYGSKSIDKKYKNVVMLTRAWHFNWSKFYFYKKNYNYIYALTRIIPNFYQAIRNFFINLIKLNLFGAKLNLVEMYGILSSIFLLKSFYRAK